MSDDTPDDDIITSDTALPKWPTPRARESWWLTHPGRDGFTKRAEAEIPRMSASTESRLVNSVFIVGHNV